MPGSSRMTIFLMSSGDGPVVGVALAVPVGLGEAVGVCVPPGWVGVALVPVGVDDAPGEVAVEGVCWSGCATPVELADAAGVVVDGVADADGAGDPGLGGPAR